MSQGYITKKGFESSQGFITTRGFSTGFEKILFANYPLTSDLNDLSEFGNVATFSRPDPVDAYISSLGTIDSFLANVPIFDVQGLRHTIDTENIILQSQNFSTWALSKVTSSAQTSPLDTGGDTKALLLTAIATDDNVSTHDFVIKQTWSPAGAKRFFSVSIKRSTANFAKISLLSDGFVGGGTIFIKMSDYTIDSFSNVGSWVMADVISTPYIARSDGTEWTYLTFNCTTGSDTSVGTFLGMVDDPSDPEITSGKTIYYWQSDNTDHFSYPIFTTTVSVTSGDTDISIDSSVFPANDYTIAVDITSIESEAGVSYFPYDHRVADDNGVFLGILNAQWSLHKEIAAVQHSANATQAIIKGTTYPVLATLSSDTGMEMDVNGNTGNNGNTGDTTIAATATIGKAHDGTFPFNGYIKSLKVRSL